MPPMWNRSGQHYYAADDTHTSLPPGYYKLVLTQQGPCVVRNKLNTDSLLALPDTATVEILAEIEKFWTLRERFLQRGMLHKRGVLLYGEHGTGKTASVMQIAESIINDQNGIVVQIENPLHAAQCLSMIRRIEPNRPIVATMEDIDSLVVGNNAQHFLSLLDGENQVDHIVYVATTNYFKRLEKRFTDRPSRFDIVREIDIPSAEARRAYLMARDPTIENIDAWVPLTQSFSIAYLREFIILVQCFGIKLEDAAERLHRMRSPKQKQSAGPGEETQVLTMDA